MLITITVFAILSVISLLIFLVESIDHQRVLRRHSTINGSPTLGNGLRPIMITTIKDGTLHETFYYIPEEEDQHPKKFNHKIEGALLKSLLMRTQMFVN